MLKDEIDSAQRRVRTDAYQMSIGEIVGMYEAGEIVIDPEFQRLFRWNIGQKSKLIESLLLGIPLPSIFVFEAEDGRWELIDGLQRISTILEFMGLLKSPESGLRTPSILEATKYLPSLHNTVWNRTAALEGVPLGEQNPLEKSLQLAIRRSRLGVEILKRPSDELTKFDLFQRLNAGGTPANSQELRNCIILMINRDFFHAVREEAESEKFLRVLSINEDQQERQRHLEMAVRFLVHTNIPYDGTLDVEEYIDEGVVQLATRGDIASAKWQIQETFNLLDRTRGRDALRRIENDGPVGKVGLMGLEGIAVGIAKNLNNIVAQADGGADFVNNKIAEFWKQPEIDSFTSPGMRGTTRIQRTVPFGEIWFRP